MSFFKVLDVGIGLNEKPAYAGLIQVAGNDVAVLGRAYKTVNEIAQRKTLTLIRGGLDGVDKTHRTRGKEVAPGELGYFEAFRDVLFSLSLVLEKAG